MNWRNAKRDERPKSGQKVVISVGGIYYIATYNAEKNCFESTNHADTGEVISSHVWLCDDHEIYWVSIDEPKSPFRDEY
jgi:hypothetical protein